MQGNIPKDKFSFTELRIIGISLAVLSLGMALAWIGLFWLSEKHGGNYVENKSATSSGKIK